MNNDFITRRIPVEVDEEVVIPTLDGSAIAERVTVKVPALRDPVDGEIYLTEEALSILDDTKARYMGLLLPARIKELRSTLNLTQKEISGLLQIGEKTWTRWESGRERPSRSLNLLLQALYDGRIDVAYLRLQREPSLARPEGLPNPRPAGAMQPEPATYTATEGIKPPSCSSLTACVA
jgi:DNA-binding transcriptional regulator YiaG